MKRTTEKVGPTKSTAFRVIIVNFCWTDLPGGGIEFEVFIEELLGTQGEGSNNQAGGGQQTAAGPRRHVVRVGGGAQPRSDSLVSSLGRD